MLQTDNKDAIRAFGGGLTETHSVQLSYSSPTLGFCGSYVREGVSKTFLSAINITRTAPMASIVLGSKGNVEGADI